MKLKKLSLDMGGEWAPLAGLGKGMLVYIGKVRLG